MVTLVIAVVIVIVASGICSGVEAALFSVPLIKVQQLAQTKKAAALALLNIRQNMSRPIAAIVILTNLSNIVGTIIVGGIATAVLGSQWLGLFSAILTFLIIILSEIITKTLGERHAETIALLTARAILLITTLLTPVIVVIEKIISPINRGEEPSFTTNEEEIRLLARIGQKEGVIAKRESSLIEQVFQMNDVTAVDLMTPRVEMTYLEGQAKLAEVQDQIIDSQHSRIIITLDTPDEVTGVALKGELLAAIIQGREAESVSALQHQVPFVLETEPADKLLAIFQEARQHLAVVLDEYSGVSGVVSLEDVLEVLTGEIVDETDQAVDLQEVARKRRDKYPLT
ncbi:MAG: hemolysin family protein [Chloroflexota bacterium]